MKDPRDVSMRLVPVLADDVVDGCDYFAKNDGIKPVIFTKIVVIFTKNVEC